MAITGKLSAEAWAALPAAVRDHLRDHLGIAPGDEAEWELREGCAVLRPRARTETPAEHAFPFFAEWSCPTAEGDGTGKAGPPAQAADEVARG